jgi:rRNA biogenesis protein RRP5
MDKPSSHKSRKKQAQRRREEQEITRRETALADGTADENPETAGDFERLLAGNPNSSELWIRYMAFYLSLADIPSARKVADKALGRIEFREETEKLNVWTALLTLEHKYGSDDSLQKTVDKACGHCNPKQVYLRVCEILEKDASNSESVTRANNMFAKMCKKFKSKKKVWLAHLEYLLKQSRHQDAHALLKRALLSLATYKHAETMSKFAQLEFEHGSAERARTLFDGILERYPKRLDLFFVYLDKEVKFGKASSARASFERKVEEGKLADKQMKSLFKKWFRMEEEHGAEEQQQHVKDTAKEYVQRTSN